MKTTNLTTGITVIAAVFFLASCNANNQQTNEQQDHAQHQEEKAAILAQDEIAKTNSEELNALYPHYLALQEALVNGDITKAKEAALLVQEAGKQLSEAQILQNATNEILSAETLAAQRDAFSPLSDALITLIKSNGVSEGAFYIAHCPMAFNDKGANWISPSKTIKNPYFGDKMLTCGTVEETLKHL